LTTTISFCDTGLTLPILQDRLRDIQFCHFAEADSEKEEKKRQEADFLLYRDEKGEFADFHCLRHTFITNLSMAKVSPKMAQTLARHSDIALTMKIYTHVDQEEQIEAINALPGLEPEKETEKE
jgi:integrase